MALKVPKANNIQLFKDGYKVRDDILFSLAICNVFCPSKCLASRTPSCETSKPSPNYPTLSGQVLGQTVRDITLSLPTERVDGGSGRNKLVINHLGRLFVTSDAATIIREIEVVHPAAKLLVMASQAQETEVSTAFICYVWRSMRIFCSDGRRN